MYKVLWDLKFLQDLKKLDTNTAKNLISKVETHLVLDPISMGKTLSHKFKNLYRYRFGKYRIIYEIYKQQVQIIIVKVSNRDSVYD